MTEYVCARRARYRYKHADMEDLEEQLKKASGANASVLSLLMVFFSMDGDIAKLDQICDLADKYNALVMVDDCHAAGFIGKTGSWYTRA